MKGLKVVVKGILGAPAFGRVTGPLSRDWILNASLLLAVGNRGPIVSYVLLVQSKPSECSFAYVLDTGTSRIFSHKKQHVEVTRGEKCANCGEFS